MSLLWLLTSLTLGQTLPEIQAETLSGAAITLPSSLTAAHTVLVLSFQREHQEVSDTWRPHLAGLAAAGDVGWYELAFLDVSAPVKLAIGTAMDMGIRDEQARKHVAPVWSSHEAVRKQLGIEDDQQAAIVVVDRAGAVTFKAAGPPTDETVAALKAAL